MNRSVIIAASFLFVTLQTTPANADCSEILRDGLRSKYSIAFRSDFSTQSKHAICSSRMRSRSGGSGIDLNVPIPEIKSFIGLGASDEYSSERLDEFCSNDQTSVDSESVQEWAVNTLDAEIVEAWRACKVAGGFTCVTRPLAGSDFAITLGWKRTNTGAGTRVLVLTGPPLPSNARCTPPPALDVGTTIVDDSKLDAVCRRLNDSDDAFVILNSSQSSTTCYHPRKIENPEPRETDLEACKAGKQSGCDALAAEALRLAGDCEAKTAGIANSTDMIAARHFVCGGLSRAAGKFLNFEKLAAAYRSSTQTCLGGPCPSPEEQIDQVFVGYAESVRQYQTRSPAW